MSYGIDKVGLTVWVDNRATSEREMAGRLCRRHANALIVPRGWTLDDRRESIPRLFKALAEEVAANDAKPKRRAAKKRATPTERPTAPSLFEASHEEASHEEASPSAHDLQTPVVQVPEATETIVDPDETQAIPWSPRLGSTTLRDDDDEDGPVFGRLLGRAFGQKTSHEED